MCVYFFFEAEDGIRDRNVTGVQTCALPISSPAFRHGQGNYLPGVGYRDTMRFSQWLNLTGLPGASVPAGVSKEGLPIGVQVVGRPFEDELVLAVAEAIAQGRCPLPAPPSD